MLTEQHRQDLYKSGLTDTTIEQLGFWSASAEKVAELLGKTETNLGSGMVIPYPLYEGYVRIKMDVPIIDPKTGKKKRKYMSKTGSGNHFYMHPLIQAIKADPKINIILTEGEKKAAKACQEGFHTIGLSGVWNWLIGEYNDEGVKVGSDPLPDFEMFIWSNRRVYITFDNDAVKNPDIAKAAIRLKTELEKRGAKVVIRHLPNVEGLEKVGVDDFLVAKGNDEFKKFLELNPVLPDVHRNFEIEKVVKTKTKNPVYDITIEMVGCGLIQMRMGSEQYAKFESFKHEVFKKVNMFPQFEKPKLNWELYIQEKMANGVLEEKDAGEEADSEGMIKVYIRQKLSERGKLKQDPEDFQHEGTMLEKDELIHIRGKDLVPFVSKMVKSSTAIKMGEVWMVAQDMGAKKSEVRAGKKVVRVWSFPKSVLDHEKIEEDATTDEEDATTDEVDPNF